MDINKKKNIFILGAGRCSCVLIQYLMRDKKLKIRIGDRNIKDIKEKLQQGENIKYISINVHDEKSLVKEIQRADIIISMLPSKFHYTVAKISVGLGKDMVTASYISPEMRNLNEKAKDKGVILLNEIGLDPGIDYLSAQKIIDDLKSQGASITSFKSYTGGLVAPEYDNNPWHYKFTWNPNKVVLAGQGTTQYLEKGRYKYIPYHKVFTRLEPIHIEGFDDFESYPNRNSLAYREIYGLENIQTIIRGTIRKKGFCKDWNRFVSLGITDDSYTIEDSKNMTFRSFTNSFLEYNTTKSVEEKAADYLGISLRGEEMRKLKWIGIFDNCKINLPNATPAQILQHLLEEKWKFNTFDRDMIIMQHKLEYDLNRETKELISSMVIFGEDECKTAMAKTVGLPVAIAAKYILNGNIKIKGVQRPNHRSIYMPLLPELEKFGISFQEKIRAIVSNKKYEEEQV